MCKVTIIFTLCYEHEQKYPISEIMPWYMDPANTRHLYNICTTQKARDIHPIPVRCWASVVDGGPVSRQHWLICIYMFIRICVEMVKACGHASRYWSSKWWCRISIRCETEHFYLCYQVMEPIQHGIFSHLALYTCVSHNMIKWGFSWA